MLKYVFLCVLVLSTVTIAEVQIGCNLLSGSCYNTFLQSMMQDHSNDHVCRVVDTYVSCVKGECDILPANVLQLVQQEIAKYGIHCGSSEGPSSSSNGGSSSSSSEGPSSSSNGGSRRGCNPTSGPCLNNYVQSLMQDRSHDNICRSADTFISCVKGECGILPANFLQLVHQKITNYGIHCGGSYGWMNDHNAGSHAVSSQMMHVLLVLIACLFITMF